MKGLGAIILLVVFFAFLLLTLGVPDLPIGRQLYGLFGVAESDYPVLGIGVTTLVSAVLNGVFYGVITWLIFTRALASVTCSILATFSSCLGKKRL